MKMFFASTNETKIKEYREMIEYYNLDIDLVPMKDIGYTADINENGRTYWENANIKNQELQYYIRKNITIDTPYAVLADDSGVEITALDGAPGIYSHRCIQDIEQRYKLFSDIEALSDKSATYCTMISLSTNYDGLDFSVILNSGGRCSGYIDLSATPNIMDGNVYNNIFIPDAAAPRNFASLTPDER